MRRVLILALAIFGSLIAFALVAGPSSATWGRAAYGYALFPALLASAVGPFVVAREWPPWKRALASVGSLLGCLVAWAAGFLLGGFPLLTRLF